MDDNFVLPNGTLKNLAGATTREQLTAAEAELVPQRRNEWLAKPRARRTFDTAYLRAIHRHLFQDVFEWAGRTRDERIRLSDGAIATIPGMVASRRAGTGPRSMFSSGC